MSTRRPDGTAASWPLAVGARINILNVSGGRNYSMQLTLAPTVQCTGAEAAVIANKCS
jgi:hypothetical protein